LAGSTPCKKRKPLSAAAHGQNPTLALHGCYRPTPFSNANANKENIATDLITACVYNGFIAQKYFGGFGWRVFLIPFAH